MPIPVPYTLAPGAVAPTRATAGSAGLDLYARLPSGPLMLDRGERACIGTGVSLALPPGYEGQVRPRSGLALQHGLTVLNSPGTIDADYRGEVSVILINHGTRDIVIRDGDRIAQLVVCPAPAVELVPADSLPPTARGAGGFGSTGTGPDAEKAPVALTRRSPDAARAYHEGYAAALRSFAGWLRSKADASAAIAAQHGVVGGWLGDCTTDADDDRARMESRIRALEAEVAEARAEAEGWAAELDVERAAVVAWLRSQVPGATAAACLAYDHAASEIAAGEHRAGGAR